MAQTGGYREELENELKQTDPNSHASRLIAQEIERLSNGEDEKKETSHSPHLDAYTDKPQKLSVKIRIPVREHPRYNFVGKLLGPKGSTLQALQDQTGCKMAIMGRGSMKDKDKEEDLRKSGGKYAHLNEELHILVECFCDYVDGHHRVAHAIEELRKIIIPQMQDEMNEGGDMGMNGSYYRGGFRGPDRGGRGGFRGRGNGPAAPPPGRGAPSGRGGPPSRGAPRGAPSGRGAPPARGGGVGRGGPGGPGGPGASYESGYSSQAYNTGYGSSYETGYDDGSYGQSYTSGSDSQYYDYGPSGTGSASGYDSYSGGYDYDYAVAGGENWGSGGGKTAASARGGASRGQPRPHPYSRQSGGSGSGGGY